MIWLIDYTSALIMQLSTLFFFGKLVSKKSCKKIKTFIIISIVGIIQILLNMYGIKLISTLFSIIYFYYLFQYTYEVTKKEAKNYSVIIWTISLLLDLMVMVSINFLNIIPEQILDIKLNKSISSFAMSGILFIIANIKPIIRFLNKLYTKLEKIKISMPHITMIVIAFLFIGFMSSKNMADKFVITILLITGVSLLFVILSFISMRYQIVTYQRTNEILEKNDNTNRKIITQYRILKHNLESQLLGVKSVSNKQAKELIDDLIREYNSSFYVKHDINEMPSGINGLVFEKLYKYQNKNIDITIKNKIKKNILESIGPRSYNLFCEALGVTLDNALESAMDCEKNKVVYLEFKENKESVTLKIMNTFTGFIDVDKLGTVQYTSKEKGHGFGLFSLIGRKNLTITTNIKNNLFINLIEVKKKENK